MSESIELNNIQERLERTVFHSIRDLCIGLGYTPDISEFDQTAAGYQAYMKAFSDIAAGDRGFAIDVFNAGPASERQIKQVPRIVLDSQGFTPGDIGGDWAPVYQANENNKYDKYRDFDLTSDFYFNIWTVARNITQQRILRAIISRVIPRRGYMALYNNEDIKINTIFLSSSKTFDFQVPGIMEHSDRYIFKDLHEVGRTFINEIPALTEITLNIDSQL